MKYKKILKFSIIVVSLNTKDFFLKTINSIIKQEYKNFEIIVIDGKSIDGTQDVILKKKKYFSKYIIEKDTGVYHAMNKGIVLSKGEWIIFMNSGDIFFNKFVLQKISKKISFKLDVIFGDTSIDHLFLNVCKKSNYFHENTAIMPFCHQSVFVKSSLLKKQNFSLKYRYSSDFNFFYSCYLNKKNFKKINLIISKVVSGGLADKNRQKVFNENLMIVERNNSKNLKYILFKMKLNQYFKDLCKMVIPDFIKKIILKNKYRNSILK